MDDNFQDILDSFLEKRSRSRSEPYDRLIDEQLRRGWPYIGGSPGYWPTTSSFEQ
jgi:hypothetical protein